jgi:hypothetical protein
MRMITVYQTYAGWKWWMRFVNVVEVVYTSGCFHDSCGDISDGCICNSWNVHTKLLEMMGYKKLGYNMRGMALWGDGRRYVIELYSYGR